MGLCWTKGTELQLCRMSKSIALITGMITILNHTVLNTGYILESRFQVLYTQEMVTM